MIAGFFDECYMFDVLAVAKIKLETNRNMPNLSNYERHFNSIEMQIGRKKMDIIIESEEFKKMIEVNQKLFSGFNKIKTEEGRKEISALDLDSLNFDRHLAKISLQNKFFPEIPLTEVKIGYEQK